MIPLSFVAFIDILGFGAMVTRDCESAAPGSLYLNSLKSAIHETLAHAQSIEAKIVQFSDSIVVSSPFKPDKKEFIDFIELAKKLQKQLFLGGILSRGGITHGRHFHDETILFSQALIDAYNLESKVARNPRVIISVETVSLIFHNIDEFKNAILDVDGQYFIDYLSGVNIDELAHVLTSFKPQLKSSDANVRSKTAWLFRYANFCDPSIEIPSEIQMRRI